MLGRKIVVDVVKENTTKDDQIDAHIAFEERAVYVGAAASNAIAQAGRVVVAYIAADTIRKILVSQLSK